MSDEKHNIKAEALARELYEAIFSYTSLDANESDVIKALTQKLNQYLPQLLSYQAECSEAHAALDGRLGVCDGKSEIVVACEEYVRAEDALPNWCDGEDYCLSKSVENIVAQLAEAEAECERLMKDCDRLECEMKSYAAERDHANDNLELCRAARDLKSDIIATLRPQLATVNDAAAKGEAGRNLGAALEEAVKENAELRAELAECQHRHTLRDTSLNEVSKSMQIIRAERDELKATVASITKEGLTLEKEREVLRGQRDKLQKAGAMWKQFRDVANEREQTLRNELNSVRTREAALSNSCPCCHTTPCHPRCTCAAPASSFGCLRCCKYGSKEQQRHIAEGIVAREAALMECVKALQGFLGEDDIEKEIADARKALTAVTAAGIDLNKL